MKIDIQSDPEHENRHRQLKAPTDFTSRAIRLRLFMLFGMLLAVIILMYEARKPERWEWMGFGKVNQPAANPDDAQLDKALPNANLDPDQDETKDDAEPPNDPGVGADDNADRFEQELANQAATATYPVEAVRFWQSTFVSYKTSRQKQLFQLLRFIRSNSSPAEIDPDQLEGFKKLVASLEIKRQNFHTELLNKISFLSNEESEKKKLNQQLLESKSLWMDKVLPGLNSALNGQGTTVSQLAAIERLQTVLDQLAFAQVADGETLRRPAEGMAWLRMWELILDSKKEQYEPVTHIQLSSQPLAFRGRPIQIKGWIRSARKFAVPENEIGLDYYYVLWLRPSDTNLAPYCVYTQELPSGFPHVTSATIKLNEPATVNGRFFKIHSYNDSKSNIANCPLILAKSFDWRPIVANPVSKIDSWTPPRWLIIAAFIGLPIFAAGIAWITFRNTQMRRFEPGTKTQNNIKKNLTVLRDDESVQTDQDKVGALYEMDQTGEDPTSTD